MKKENCIVCNHSIDNEEIKLLSNEFKHYPAHKECFDTYETAENFLEHAIELLNKGE